MTGRRQGSMEQLRQAVHREVNRAIDCVLTFATHKDFKIGRPDYCSSTAVMVRPLNNHDTVVVCIDSGGLGSDPTRELLQEIWEDIKARWPASSPFLPGKPVWRDSNDGIMRLAFVPRLP